MKNRLPSLSFLTFLIFPITGDAEQFQTASHPQLVRKFFGEQDGLPTEPVRAIAVTNRGNVFAATADQPWRLDGDRWMIQLGPTRVTALSASAGEREALAGSADGVWVLAHGRWQKDEGSPAGVLAFAGEPGDVSWALAPSGVWRHTDRWQLVHALHPRKMSHPASLLPLGPDDVWVACDTGLFGLMGKRKYWLEMETGPGRLHTTDVRALAKLDNDHHLIATDQGLVITNGTNGWQTITGQDGLPILELKSATVASNGTVWLGSDQGLIRWHSGRFTYLAGKRWLPNDRVSALATAPDGSVWVGTENGVAHIYERRLTLAEKAAIYQRDLESRDRRHGFVTVMHLREPGVLAGATQEISDNDGLWTSLYIAAQSFRFAVQQDAKARAQASRSMAALLRLESITGIPGFPARAIVHVDEPAFAAQSIGANSEWHPSTIEKGWYWKGDTSSDELDGHYFAWYVFNELAADEKEKLQVRATCKRVTDHILDHGYYLVDHDGKPTTWAVWAPEKLNDDPKWWQGRGLNSLEILSHLKVAHHIVGDPRYEQAYHDLIRKHRYALNALHAKTTVGHDDQLMFLAFYPLLILERDPGLRNIYLTSIRRAWNMERIEANPLWNLIYGAGTGEPCDVEAAVQSLREIPLDLITWKVQNSHRADLRFDPDLEARGIKQLREPLPFTERAIHKWDGNPFVLDSGNNLGEGDPTIWLLPYWLGRHHRLIE